jgi:hypothetical protein
MDPRSGSWKIIWIQIRNTVTDKFIQGALYSGKYPPSANIIWRKKYKRGENIKEKGRKGKEKNKKGSKGSNKCKIEQN